MMSIERAWQMPSLDLGYQFFSPPSVPGHDSASLESTRKQFSRRSVGSGSTGSESANRETRRNFHRKVRTGCATCKVRHVKCDEAKPSCRRCTSTGRKCDGYPQLKNQRQNAPLLPRSSSKGPVSIAPTRSRSGSEETVVGNPDKVILAASLRSPRKSLGFFEPDEPLEQRYLEMFHVDTLPQIWRLEIAQPAAWRKLVMQLVQTEPAVRQSAIALAAAHERQKLVASGVRDDPNKLALAYYNKAIHHITDNSGNKANSTHDPVVLLTMCLLFVAIEMFLNRDGPTRIHIQSGVRILQEVEFAEHAADEEDMIGNSFQALETHAAIYPGWGASKYEGGILTRPAMISHGGASGRPGGKPRLEDLGEAIREYYSIVAEATQHINGFANNASPAIRVQLAARDRMQRDIAAWRVAWAELKERPCADEDDEAGEQEDGAIRPDQAFLANLLELSMETIAIVLRGAFDPTQTEYDEMLPEIAALVTRLRHSIETRDPESSNFSVDTLSNEVSSLWYLFCACRNPALRREMRELVWVARARRGAWCTMSTHLVMGRILEIEEAGVVNPREAADIPADQRLIQMCIDVAGARRDVRVRYRYTSDRVHAIEEVLKHPPRPSSLENPPV